MQTIRNRFNRSIEETLNFVLTGLIALITIAIFLQRPFDWRSALGASGFLLFYVAWTGIYSRLKHELPDHPLATTSWLGFKWSIRGRRRQRLLPWSIIRFHFERHRLDLWTTLLIAGALMLVGSIPFGD